MPEFEFTVASENGLLSVEGDEQGVTLSQPTADNDPDREPRDVDVIHLTIAEAREFHRKLGKALGRQPI